MFFKLRDLFLSTCTTWVLILRWVESSSGSVADRALPTSTSAKICAPSCAPRSPVGSRTAVHLRLKPEPLIRVPTRTGDSQRGWHCGNSRKIDAYDCADY